LLHPALLLLELILFALCRVVFVYTKKWKDGRCIEGRMSRLSWFKDVDVDRGFGRFVGVDFYENQPRDIFPRVVLNLVDKGTWLDDDNVASGLRSLASFAV
jgi:hypothetical protein